MADKRRQEKVAEAIRNQAGKFFSAEQPTNTLTTVTEVSMSPDLNYATIYISILPANKQEEALRKIKQALPGLRRQIGDRLKLRKVPELRIKYDERAEAEKEVEKILEDDSENRRKLSPSHLKRILNKLAWWRS